MKQSNVLKEMSKVHRLKGIIEEMDLWKLRDFLARVGVNSALDETGVSPLMLAAQGPSLEPLKLMRSLGADVNQTDYFGASTLFYAADKGSCQNVKYLLAQGANLHLKDNDGETALLKAALSGSEDVVRLLIQRGARINSRSSFDGTTALMNAAAGCHVRILRYLIRRGAFKRTKDFLGRSAIDWFKESLSMPVCLGSASAFA